MKKTHSDDSSFPGRFASGLTKREYFAAMAMQGMLSNPYYAKIVGESMPDHQQADFICQCSVEQADALIEALNKEEI